MRSLNILMSILALAAIGLGTSPAPAQVGMGGSEASIMGTGTTTISRPPAIVQVHVVIPAKGGSLKEAIARLKERQDKARELLGQLQADSKSITFSPPAVSEGKSEQRKQFEAMVAQRMQAMGRETPEGLKMPKTCTVTSTLSANWLLAGKTVEEMLIETDALREKVEATDLAGMKEDEAASLEEQEIMEEMEGMEEYSSGFGNDEEVKPGTPAFTYLARITEDERAQAMAEAYQKAQIQAQALAKAAGVKTGALIGLSGGSRGETDFSGDMYNYQYNEYAQRMAARSLEGMNRDLEAVGPTPESLKFTFHVTAVYQLQTP